MRLVWTPRSLRNLHDIASYVATDSEAAASRLVARLEQGAGLLAAHPSAGRTGRIEGTREWPVPRTRYVIVYRLRPDCVEIAAVVHTSRQWPVAA